MWWTSCSFPTAWTTAFFLQLETFFFYENQITQDAINHAPYCCSNNGIKRWKYFARERKQSFLWEKYEFMTFYMRDKEPRSFREVGGKNVFKSAQPADGRWKATAFFSSLLYTCLLFSCKSEIKERKAVYVRGKFLFSADPAERMIKRAFPLVNLVMRCCCKARHTSLSCFVAVSIIIEIWINILQRLHTFSTCVDKNPITRRVNSLYISYFFFTFIAILKEPLLHSGKYFFFVLTVAK